MTEERQDKRERLDKIVKSRIKGLGLDALFHQVDLSKKDEEQAVSNKQRPSAEEMRLIERLKRGLPAKMGKAITSKASVKLVLDIGSASVKLVELRRSKDKILLSKAVYLPIPHMVTTSPEKLEKFLLDTLAQIIDFKTIKKSFVSTILPRSKAVVKFLSFPTQEGAEVKKMLEFEAEHHLPFPLSEAEMDYQIIKRQPNDTKLILVAIKKDEISTHLSLLDKLGIKPDTIELSALAVYNSLLPYLPKEGVFLEINIGAAYTDINIIKDAAISFTRGINWGSHQLTLSLSQALNVSFEDAEKIKKENGICLSKKVSDPTKKSISEMAVAWADNLANEINRTISSFQLEKGLVSIKQIVLGGGGSRLINLNEYLKDKLKTKVSLQQACKDVEFEYAAENYNRYSRELNLLLGLAWRGFGSGQLELNLLPEKIKYSRQLKKQKARRLAYAAALTIAAALLLLLPAGIMKLRDKQINRLDKALKELRPAASVVQDLKEKIQTIEDYTSTKQSCMEILREISIIISPDITINSFIFEKNESVILAGSASSHASAVNLSKTLGESSLFAGAKLRHTRKKGIPGKQDVDFEIVCNLIKPEAR
jgi:type IV pilus assembly protein PilM